MGEDARSPRICMVGSSMVDLIARVPRLPVAGETLVGTSFRIGFGGKGSNQAVMAARLGAQVSVVVSLGRDVFGENTLRNYRDQGIDTRHVIFDEERFSGVAPIAVEEGSGRNAIIVVPGANDGLGPEEVRRARDAIAAADVLLCQLEIPLESTLEAFRLARQAGDTLTVLNPAPAAELPAELLELTDVCVPNEVEAAVITGMTIETSQEAVRAAEALQRRGPKTVIVTLGERGAVFVGAGVPAQHVPAPDVDAVDSTGAGDAFVGSLAYFLASRVPLRSAVERACAIASRSVLGHGTQTSFPYRDEVAGLLAG